ncbi:hypothetical protein BKA67DRAFT_533647 [Truncatella angustata]|uniref:enoyl-[acyl-carrier-protein] reductase n=1 Tax=Truncatella angustata TaxID=152316 RepID=A0A9P8UUL9_9PEZI|nr:uncharacterized protein BKA67DRAFT_533647 [Truncatella angustata]KAH6658494.1 hypothetical protein BKA67DRAFT_533647 [Truncatella angustata]
MTGTSFEYMACTLVLDTSSPSTPVRLIAHETPGLRTDSIGNVHVKFLASPVNRVDLMVLSGQYPVKPHNTHDSYPIPGFDGCGVVTESTSATISKGDIVIPRSLGAGTWRSDAVFPESSLLKLPASTPVLAGALLRSGALVAWLLLEEIKSLRSGDTIIISAGTSSVAYFLVQLARLKGVAVIVVIRDRAPEAAELVKTTLSHLGAASVLTESELADGTVLLPSRPVLALDCVYGHVGQLLADTLAPQGTFALVGLLSGPGSSISVSTGHLFARQLSFVPFRGSEILKKMGETKSEELICHVAGLFGKGDLKIPELTLVSWQEANPHVLNERLQQALENSKEGEIGTKKTVWIFS